MQSCAGQAYSHSIDSAAARLPAHGFVAAGVISRLVPAVLGFHRRRASAAARCAGRAPGDALVRSSASFATQKAQCACASARKAKTSRMLALPGRLVQMPRHVAPHPVALRAWVTWTTWRSARACPADLALGAIRTAKGVLLHVAEPIADQGMGFEAVPPGIADFDRRVGRNSVSTTPAIPTSTAGMLSAEGRRQARTGDGDRDVAVAARAAWREASAGTPFPWSDQPNTRCLVGIPSPKRPVVSSRVMGGCWPCRCLLAASRSIQA